MNKYKVTFKFLDQNNKTWSRNFRDKEAMEAFIEQISPHTYDLVVKNLYKTV